MNFYDNFNHSSNKAWNISTCNNCGHNHKLFFISEKHDESYGLSHWAIEMVIWVGGRNMANSGETV